MLETKFRTHTEEKTKSVKKIMGYEKKRNGGKEIKKEADEHKRKEEYEWKDKLRQNNLSE
jgi:hypothetical protein